MSEPITLHKDGETVTLFAPSVALDLQAQGWRMSQDFSSWMASMEQQAQDALADDDVPFDFKDAYVDESEFVNISEPAPKPAKRGRPRKAK